MQRRDPPPPSTVSDIERMFSRDSGLAIQASDEIVEVFNALKTLKSKAKMLDSEIEDAERQIKLFLGDGMVEVARWSRESGGR